MFSSSLQLPSFLLSFPRYILFLRWGCELTDWFQERESESGHTSGYLSNANVSNRVTSASPSALNKEMTSERVRIALESETKTNKKKLLEEFVWVVY